MKKDTAGRPVTREDVLDHLEKRIRNTPAYEAVKPHIDATREEFGGMERYVHRQRTTYLQEK